MTMNYPTLEKKASPSSADWWYMKGERIHYYRTGKKFAYTPHLQYFGLIESDQASILQFRDLTEAVHEAINWSAKACGGQKIHHGLSIPPDKGVSGADPIGEYMLWGIPVYVTDKDRAVINLKVYTDKVHGGSTVLWCNPFVMDNIPSMAQFETQGNTALQFAEEMRKRYTLKNL
jgi:hypothetical protein